MQKKSFQQTNTYTRAHVAHDNSTNIDEPRQGRQGTLSASALAYVWVPNWNVNPCECMKCMWTTWNKSSPSLNDFKTDLNMCQLAELDFWHGLNITPFIDSFQPLKLSSVGANPSRHGLLGTMKLWTPITFPPWNSAACWCSICLSIAALSALKASWIHLALALGGLAGQQRNTWGGSEKVSGSTDKWQASISSKTGHQPWLLHGTSATTAISSYLAGPRILVAQMLPSGAAFLAAPSDA